MCLLFRKQEARYYLETFRRICAGSKITVEKLVTVTRMADYHNDRETTPLAPAEAAARPSRPVRPQRPAPPASRGGSCKGPSAPVAAPDWEKYGLQGDAAGVSAEKSEQISYNQEKNDDEEVIATFDWRQKPTTGNSSLQAAGENNEIFSEHQVQTTQCESKWDLLLCP